MHHNKDQFFHFNHGDGTTSRTIGAPASIMLSRSGPTAGFETARQSQVPSNRTAGIAPGRIVE
jgi:hypothetical protein